MLRSMFSAASGLGSHQTLVGVAGNNVHTVNTSGDKSQRATFQAPRTQVVRGSTAPQPGQGGINPMRLGLGTRTAGIDRVLS